jgi:hypothetical protein
MSVITTIDLLQKIEQLTEDMGDSWNGGYCAALTDILISIEKFRQYPVVRARTPIDHTIEKEELNDTPNQAC